MRIASNNAFTDLVLDDGSQIRAFKAPTTLDPTRGVLDAVSVAAKALALDSSALLSRRGVFVHGTTRALNAMLTQTTARTGFSCRRATRHPALPRRRPAQPF